MALKDSFKGLLSFLDTNDMNELEEREEVVTSYQEQSVTNQERQTYVREEVPVPKTQARNVVECPLPPSSPSQESYSIHTKREELLQKQVKERIVIDLKYPKRYEDAQDIVDLLIENESVLIDFQYMTDAQARRCIDFIDGASKVLFGNLNKVSGTMYLLTPSNVTVNIDDLAVPHHGQDISYDYDMKRR